MRGDDITIITVHDKKSECIAEVSEKNFQQFCKAQQDRLRAPVAIAINGEDENYLLASPKHLDYMPPGLYTGQLVMRVAIPRTQHEVWICV